MNINNFEKMESIDNNNERLKALNWWITSNPISDVSLNGDTSEIMIKTGEGWIAGLIFPTVHAARRALVAFKTGTLEDLIIGAKRAKSTFPQEMWDAYAWWVDEDEY